MVTKHGLAQSPLGPRVHISPTSTSPSFCESHADFFVFPVQTAPAGPLPGEYSFLKAKAPSTINPIFALHDRGVRQLVDLPRLGVFVESTAGGATSTASTTCKWSRNPHPTI